MSVYLTIWRSKLSYREVHENFEYNDAMWDYLEWSENGLEYECTVVYDDDKRTAEIEFLSDDVKTWAAEHAPEWLETREREEADDRWIDERKHEGRLL